MSEAKPDATPKTYQDATPDPAYPVPLRHFGCGAVLYWADEAPIAGQAFYAETVVTHDGLYPDSTDSLAGCPKCGADVVSVELITWDGDPRRIN